MPVKVRCGECEQSFNVPDKVRGKTIACPKCSGKIKVPAGDDAPAKAPAKAKKPKQEGDLFSYGDLEDEDEAICPFCAKPIDMEEDEICPSCGRDLVTGEMDKKEAKKRSKAGKSTAYFYKNFFRETWEWTKEFKALAFRTGLYNILFTLLFLACLFMVNYCERLPPKFFWVAMTALMALGLPGWFWFLSRKVVYSEVYVEKLESDRIHFDFFSVVALGLGLVLWPGLLALPLWYFVGLIAGLDKLEIVPPELFAYAWMGITGLSAVCAVFVYPIATIHVIARHNHKAWILVDMLRITFRNIAPVMIYHVMGLLIIVPFIAIAFAVERFGGGAQLLENTHLVRGADAIVIWFLKLTGDTQPSADGFVYNLIKIGIMFSFAALTLAPYFILAGFPTIYMMKLNALIAKHFSHSLELDQQIKPGTPASLWVRFLAGATDFLCFPFSGILVSQEQRFMLIAWAVSGITTLVWVGIFMEWFPGTMAYGISIVWAIYNHWMYYCVPLANPGKATMGMEAFGLIAMRDNPALKAKELEKEMTLKEASIRWFFYLILVYIPGGIACLSSFFRPDKKMPHDMLSKTKIVFKGDR